SLLFFFFQAEDGIRDSSVTGVQTCALPIYHAHELQIVHRDLKPENIMLETEDNGRERAVVMDFGLAKERRADPAIAKLTATGIKIGRASCREECRCRGAPYS